MRTATTTLEAAPSSVSAARHWVRATLSGWGLPGTSWTAAQVVSELATNCTLHARTSFTLTLELADAGLRLEVTDSSPTVLRPRQHSDRATTGRGLHIVESLAVQWGVAVRPPGKTVWVQLPFEGDDRGDDDVQGHAGLPGRRADRDRCTVGGSGARSARALLRLT